MHGIVDLAAQRNPVAVGTDRIGADGTFDVGHFRHGAAAGRNRVQVGIAAVVIRLGDAIRGEVDARAVGTPGDVALVEIAAGELLRLRVFIVGDVDGPDVRVARGVAISGAVGSVDGLIDDADVAFGLVILFLLVFLFEIFGLGRGGEGDRIG